MKKYLRPVLCGGLLAALLCTPSLAAEPETAIPLLINGEPVTLSGAAPVFQGESIDVPAVATLEALGYKVTWDAASQTIHASKEGAALSFTLGSTAAARTGPSWSAADPSSTSGSAGASVGEVVLSKAPYVDPATWSTYLSAEDLGSLLGSGYRVAVDYGWTVDSAGSLVMSSAEAAVIVDDVDAIWAANTETYELMDQYMEYARKYNEGNYQVSGSYELSMTSSSEGIYTETDGTSYPVTTEIVNTVGGDYNMATNQTALQFDTTLSIGGTLDGQPIASTDIDVDMRCDVNGGVFYFWFQSEDLEQMLGMELPDQWYSMDMKTMYNEMYGPGYYEELVALSMASMDQTFAQSLEGILHSDLLPLAKESTTADYLELLNTLLGDSAFQKSGSTYTSTLEQDGASVSFLLYTSAGKVTGYGMEMAASADIDLDMSMVMEMRGDKMTFQFQMPGLTMEMDGTYRSTGSAPETEPPAGAAVVDLMDLMTGNLETISES